MVLIMSNSYDYSTIQVTQWLKHYNMPFIRIDGEESFKIKKVNLNSHNDFIIYNSTGKEIILSSISSVWYRRGDLHIVYDIDTTISHELLHSINIHLQEETAILSDYFYFLMMNIPHVGTFEKRGMNKLVVLYEAQKLGIKIPDTYIFDTSNSDLRSIKENMITKCISEPFMPKTSFGHYMTYTEDIIKEDTLDSRFFPSLFQKKYEKEADIRIFYLEGHFYSMAIMSQRNIQTSTDFRIYLGIEPNRKFPFKIPANLETKLHSLMNKVGLETGSIDLILSTNGEYIFLEVNPVGQFGMTSYPCNYYL